MNKIISLKKNGNPEIGYLSFFESEKDVPFEIKRVYYTYDVPINTKRGMHAHKNLQQILWCPFGKIEVILDDGYNKEKFLLDSPEKGLLITKGIWRDIYWRKEGSVLCVATSDFYNADDYIRDYEEFLEYVSRGHYK
ncbi:sugar 3,4-ketoisomerase [Bacillus sp. 1P02SD]|uniref:sugar 3,4-ketoisomerase n=1 Tax=Bacillus sp. 1P02SD TaxID=3132264 RepID=UPI00399FF4EA